MENLTKKQKQSLYRSFTKEKENLLRDPEAGGLIRAWIAYEKLPAAQRDYLRSEWENYFNTIVDSSKSKARFGEIKKAYFSKNSPLLQKLSNEAEVALRDDYTPTPSRCDPAMFEEAYAINRFKYLNRQLQTLLETEVIPKSDLNDIFS